MATAPYYYHGDPKFAELVYPEVKDADYDAYMAVRKKYKLAFYNSRPYKSTINSRGECKFGAEWGRTLKNLKQLYGFTPPHKTPATWSEVLRANGH